MEFPLHPVSELGIAIATNPAGKKRVVRGGKKRLVRDKLEKLYSNLGIKTRILFLWGHFAVARKKGQEAPIQQNNSKVKGYC